MLPRDFDLLYTFDTSRLVHALAEHVKPGGHVFLNRVGAPPPVSFMDPRIEGDVNGLIVESPSLAKGYKTVVPIAVIPALGHYSAAPPWEPRPAGQSVRVAYMGRYERPKGVFRLVDIWQRHAPAGATLDFYGSGPDQLELQGYIRKLGQEQTTRLHPGWATPEEAGQIFRQVDLCVLPSDSEGLPAILLEAMAHGVPFVASNVGGIRDLAQDNPDVTVVPLDDAALGAAIASMVERIRSGSVSGARLQAYHRERYSFEAISQQWVSALLDPQQFWSSVHIARHRQACSPEQP
ncbi:MAG: glycosyltransferase family 4 protein [Candidatus Korobacteraceae bacterium]